MDARAGTNRLPPHPTAGRAWLVVGLLFLAQVANYADKSVVSLAADSIMAEFGLTPEQYGVVAAAFFSLYAVTGVAVAALVAPRFPPRGIMAVLLVAWSLVQLPVVFAASFPMLVACRVLLGMGEGAGTPTALNAAHEWFESDARNMPSAVILFGSTAGAMIAAPVLTATIEAFGWRAAFAACAVFGAAVLLLWLALSSDGPYGSTPSRAPLPTMKRTSVRVPPGGSPLHWNVTLWGVGAVAAAAYWLTGFMVGWLAPFVRTIVADPGSAAWTLSSIFAVQALCVLGIPLLSQWLLRRGLRSRFARGWVVALCMAAAGAAFLFVPHAPGMGLKLGLVAVAMSLPAPVFPICSALISEVAPPERRNQAMTLIMSIITLAAIPSSLATGFLVGSARFGWDTALGVNGAIAIVGGLACLLLVDPGRDAVPLTSGAPR